MGCDFKSRFAYVDPIICMLCRPLGYEVELEDKMETNEDSIMENVSKDSKANYVCYVLVDNSGKPDRIPVVILEANIPITIQLMRQIKTLISAKPHSYHHTTIWAACCMAFFGLLRHGKFVTKPFNL